MPIFVNQTHKNIIMKTIKADSFHGNCQSGELEYTVGKKEFSVSGEFYYNKTKDRIEHVHIGPKGGEYLIVW